MSFTVNHWRVEVSDNDSESYLNSEHENFDSSLFSSYAVRQQANADHSRIPIQSSLSSANITFRAYFPFWQPSIKLCNLQDRFNTTILTQYPCVPCSYCSCLQYPTKAKWELYDRTFKYPLEEAYSNNPQITLVFHTDDSQPARIATCSPCYNSNNHLKIPIPDPIPDEIQTRWLRDHNPYFKPYQTLINRGTWDGAPIIFPNASLSNTSQNQDQPLFNINSRPFAQDF
ncbi:unnamed protein product [Rhizophagus irregularis]|nr:unnamed protein product [Rhizophagus irregularis]